MSPMRRSQRGERRNSPPARKAGRDRDRRLVLAEDRALLGGWQVDRVEGAGVVLLESEKQVRGGDAGAHARLHQVRGAKEPNQRIELERRSDLGVVATAPRDVPPTDLLFHRHEPVELAQDGEDLGGRRSAEGAEPAEIDRRPGIARGVTCFPNRGPDLGRQVDRFHWGRHGSELLAEGERLGSRWAFRTTAGRSRGGSLGRPRRGRSVPGRTGHRGPGSRTRPLPRRGGRAYRRGVGARARRAASR